MNEYLPEGCLTEQGPGACPSNMQEAEEYIRKGITAEALCIMCDSRHDLIVDLGFIKGIIPRCEGALGIEDGTTRDIALISRVNKLVSFRIKGICSDEVRNEKMLLLSRREAQEEAMRRYTGKLVPGDVIPARVTHMEHFGAFVDIACGIPSLIPIDLISVSRISHPSDRFFIGEDIKAVVKTVDHGKITLTHKELLGTWEQNAALYSVGETVTGTVRSVEGYGIFVELTPNLAGLAELKPDIRVGSRVSVYIKAVIPEKMKIKLIIVDQFSDSPPVRPAFPDYYISSGRIDRWKYSADAAEKEIITDFTQ